MSAQEAFQSVSAYFANDLTAFLYDYIADLLDQENTLYASELLEEFAPYMPDSIRFDCLKAKLMSETDVVQANQMIRGLLDRDLEPDQLFDILQLLAAIGDHDLFQATIKKLLPYMQDEEDIQEMMDLAVEYYRRLDLDELEQAVLRIQEKTPLDIEAFKKLVFANNVLLS